MLNFEEWLSGVRSPVESVHIYKRPDLIAELGKLRDLKERGLKPELFEGTLGDPSRYDTVRGELEASLAIFNFAPIDDSDEDAIIAAHPEPEGRPLFREAPPALPQRATEKQSEAFLAAHKAWQDRKESWTERHADEIANWSRNFNQVLSSRGAERLARSLVSIDEGGEVTEVRWTAEQIRQLKRRIGNPQMGLLIEAMNRACTKPPEEPDPFV